MSGTLTGWQYIVAKDDSTETYDAAGKLQTITTRNGWVTSLTYDDAGRLATVRNHFGRQIAFAYDTAGRIATLTTPGGEITQYAYDTAGNLTTVTRPDGNLRRYHYEDSRWPTALTGVTDELGVRIGSYAYDAQGRVVQTVKADGADRIQLAYPAADQTVVTDYASGSAQSRSYTFANSAGVLRPTAVSAPCPLCGSTAQASEYDAAGNKTREIAHDGTVTFYTYDAKGRESERATYPASYNGAATRPALSLASSVTSTQWHATWNLPKQVAEPGRISAFTYNAKGMTTGSSWTATTDATGAAKFTAAKSGSTFATGWGYNASSLNTSIVEKIDGVQTQRWTLGYNASGDMVRITDVTGGNLIGRATSYDGNGRMLTGTTALGLPVTYGYAPRGFVTSRSVNGKTSTFVQNGVGLTTEARLPDGQTVGFEYDATHRLTNVRLNGALVTARTTRGGTPENTQLAIVVEELQKAVEALVRPAHAQAFALPAGPGSVGPGMALPGQPSASPAGILMDDDRPSSGVGALPPFDARARALRSLIERATRMCQCDPSGGYDRPTLRPTGYAHILISGHMGPTWADKSYFTEPVNQALVDEVVSKAAPRDSSSGIYYVADIGREVGFARKKVDGVWTFAPTRSVTLIVEPEHCSDSFRGRNEVVTMYPEITK